jgi:group I intron endonuclease
MIIYCINNDFDDNAYVGYHKGDNVQDRWKSHIAAMNEGSTAYLHNSMRTHGIQHFHIVRVWSGHVPLEVLKAGEKYFIKCFRTRWPDGYNLTDGGDGVSSDHMKYLWTTPEYRAMQKAAREGVPNKGQFKPGYKSPKKGGHREDLLPEVRKVMSDKAKRYDDEHGNPRQGAEVTAETRKKIGDANRGKTPWNKGLKTPKLTITEKILQMKEIGFKPNRTASQTGVSQFLVDMIYAGNFSKRRAA